MREHILLIEKILAGNIKEANKKLAKHLENCKKDGINSIKKKEEVNLLEQKVY
jgi:DNA-binding GntR family transcriptional regulator